MLEKVEWRPDTTPSSVCFCPSLHATNVRMLKERKAARTDSVATALSFRPVKGNASGPRWQLELRLTRHTWFTS